MNALSVTFKDHYQTALADYLHHEHRRIHPDTVTDLCEKARQQRFCATDWLNFHGQILTELCHETTTTFTCVQRAHHFLNTCISQWEKGELSGYQQIQSQLQQLNEQLDHSLRQKAQALSEANDQLRKEIQKREYIEEIFRQNEERFYKLSANIPGMLFQCVRQTGGRDLLPYVSTRCRDILELEPGEIYHFSPVLERIPQTDLINLKQALDTSAKELVPVAWEGIFQTRSGKQKWLQIAAQPSRDHDGEVIWDGVLFDITDRREAEIERERQTQQYENLVANVPGVIYRCTVDQNWPPTYISSEIETITGYPVSHFHQGGMRYMDNITHPDDQLMLQTAINITLNTKTPYQVEYRITHTNGQLRWVLERGQIAWDQVTEQRYLDGVIIDITDLKAAEAKIQASLAEKEVLIKEIHHRVKNNLNVVHSMLAMQGRQSKNAETKEILADSQQRLQVMALIHEQLYRSEELSKINFSDYVTALTHNFTAMTYCEAAHIALKLSIEPLVISLETAIPVGLIINELLTNALKHAFPDQRSGTVQITFRRQSNHQLYLAIEDNGIGLPENFSDLSQKSLGFRLVHILADQLDAHLEITNQTGSHFYFTFESMPHQPCPTH